MASIKLAAWIVVCLFTVGCGHRGPQKYPVAGEVTWNGQPLAEGRLTLFSVDDTQLPDSADIKDGQFRLLALPGKKRVEVFATRITAPAVPSKYGVTREQFIPSRFNTESKLTAEVSTDAENRFSFKLEP